ncbi:MAG: hypothetical protein EB056_07440 [Verrucomicrobia bacterium]|nr:hypothetical protein [Verrucomicrobiota bacterium]
MGKKNARMRAFFALSLSLLLAPCWAEPPPQPVAFRVGPLLFDRPEGWRWVKPEGSFRAAQLEKSGPGKTLLLMTFSRFPAGTGGTVQANIDRWIRQFSHTSSPADVRSVTPGSYPVTLVKIRGALKGGLPGGPDKEIPDALLLGAILEAEGEMIVVKMAGSASSLSTEEKAFGEMISGAAEKRP